jgi:hypothetical protein
MRRARRFSAWSTRAARTEALRVRDGHPSTRHRPSASIEGSERESAAALSARLESRCRPGQPRAVLPAANHNDVVASIPDVATIAHQRVMPLIACVIAFGAICAACGGGNTAANHVNSEHISKATLKGTWPVTADGGTLACDAVKGGSITFSPDGSPDTYAENGTAMGWAPKEGWKDFHDIWLVDPTGAGPFVNSSDFDAEGQKLCAMNK